jgi:hypothetical protein
MNDDGPTTWYVHQLLQVPISDALPALDALAAQAATQQHPSQTDLLARSMPTRRPWARTSAVRRFTGALSLGGLWPSVPCEMTIGAWSGTASELAVRPTVRRPPARPSKRYFRAAFELLDDVARKVELVTLIGRVEGHDATPTLARALVAR